MVSNMELSDPGTVKSILARHGFRFSHSLGQNFIVDPSVCPRMAELSGAEKGTGALEIGPGVGVLTRELSARAEKVVAVELDRALEPVLAETLADCPNVKLVWGDALKLDLKKLIGEEFHGLNCILCANLPYYITSPIVMRALEEKLPLSALTVMVQKEAAERLCAEPGTRESGAVSAAVRYYAEPRVLFQVPRSCFLPQPKVDSAVLRMEIRRTPPVRVDREADFFKVVKAAFAMRRKTAVNSVSSSLGLPKDQVTEAFSRAEIPLMARAEEITIDGFAALANLLGGKDMEKS